MKFIPIFLIMLACSPKTVRAIDDIIEGEAKVIEQVVNDEIGQPAAMTKPVSKPVVVQIKKF